MSTKKLLIIVILLCVFLAIILIKDSKRAEKKEINKAKEFIKLYPFKRVQQALNELRLKFMKSTTPEQLTAIAEEKDEFLRKKTLEIKIRWERQSSGDEVEFYEIEIKTKRKVRMKVLHKLVQEELQKEESQI